MKPGMFNILVGGQWGSEGKGMAASALVTRYRPDILTTTNMANAGHCEEDIDGERFVAKALPSCAILSKWMNKVGGRLIGESPYEPRVIVGATAAFTISQLMAEAELCGLTSNGRLSIHPRTGVITEEHKKRENGGVGLEGSTKHVASTMQGCGAFLADKVMRKDGLKLARDWPELKRFVQHEGEGWPAKWTNETVLHEGAQGFSLDINHGSHYPHCTSRGTTAMQMAADMGVPANKVGDVYLVLRPFPIRVGNVYEEGKQVGFSGGHYADQEEISWEEVGRNAGMPDEVIKALLDKELTTVTRRLRRVFSLSMEQIRQSVRINGATRIILNFANYIDYGCYKMQNSSPQRKLANQLPDKVRAMINSIESATKIPVFAVGTGPRRNHVLWNYSKELRDNDPLHLHSLRAIDEDTA